MSRCLHPEPPTKGSVLLGTSLSLVDPMYSSVKRAGRRTCVHRCRPVAGGAAWSCGGTADGLALSTQRSGTQQKLSILSASQPPPPCRLKHLAGTTPETVQYQPTSGQ